VRDGRDVVFVVVLPPSWDQIKVVGLLAVFLNCFRNVIWSFDNVF